MENAPGSEKAVIGRPFEAGNPGGPGRPRGPSLSQQLLEAVQSVEARHQKPLLEHFVERAYTSDRVLIALLKKLIPDLSRPDLQAEDERQQATVQAVVDALIARFPDPTAQLQLADLLEKEANQNEERTPMT